MVFRIDDVEIFARIVIPEQPSNSETILEMRTELEVHLDNEPFEYELRNHFFTLGLPEEYKTELPKIIQFDDYIDNYFTIKTQHTSLLKIWLSEPIKEELVTLEHYAFFQNKSILKIGKTGIEYDENRLKTALEITYILSKRRRKIKNSWRAYSRKLRGNLSSKRRSPSPLNLPSIKLSRGSAGTVEVFIILRQDRFVTKIHSQMFIPSIEHYIIFKELHYYQGDKVLKRFFLEKHDISEEYRKHLYSERPDDTRRRLTEKICDLISDVSPDFLMVDTISSTVEINGWKHDEHRINQAIDLAYLLSQPDDNGPYR